MEDKDNDSSNNCVENSEDDNKSTSPEMSGEEHVNDDTKETINASEVSDVEKSNDSNTEHENDDTETMTDCPEINQKVDECTVQLEFKKPTFIIGPKRGKHGKIRSVPGLTASTKIQQEVEENDKELSVVSEQVETDTEHTKSVDETHSTNATKCPKTIPLPYQEPSWSTKPEKEYKLEVLKSGVILQTIDLNEKSFHVVGRLPNCDISLAHPTISRFHAIFQYRGVEDEKNRKGLYIYDLGSTHGTFWNGNRIRPNMYVRLYDGHMIKFGCSQRKYIVQAPTEDREEESELSVTELKEKRMLELQERERIDAEERLEMEEEEKLKKEDEENVGIDWGMGEDADEETDLTENPYAATNNEELFLNDPKKTLRGWFEREGYDLQYHTEEKGFAQFLCWVDLPIESIIGHTARAEALVKGKKKESVIQCALEACKILDRYGLLRQATHEGRKRKARNWEEDDYYSSDEDNFLDRTGSIEKKREQRMRLAGKLEAQVDTYESLMEKHSVIIKKITNLVENMRKSQKFEHESSTNVEDADEDALDAFMSSLNAPLLSKADKRRMKGELQDLRQEEARLIKLLNPLRPSNLPLLTSHIVPLNEKQKPSEMFDYKLHKEQRKNRTSQETKTAIDSDDISESKQNVCDTSKKELRKRDKDGNLRISPEKEQSNESNDAESCEHETEVTAEEAEKDLHDMKHVKVNAKRYLPENNISTSLNDRSSTDDTECKEKGKESVQQSTTKKAKVTKTIKEIYDQDIYNENYSTWVPPQNQTGDGKTSLNAKYGY